MTLKRMVAEVYYVGMTFVKFIDFNIGLSYITPLSHTFSQPLYERNEKGEIKKSLPSLSEKDTFHLPYIVAKDSRFPYNEAKVYEFLIEPNKDFGRDIHELLMFADPLMIRDVRDEVAKESLGSWMDDIKYYLNVMTDMRLIPGADTLMKIPTERTSELKYLFELEIPNPSAVALDIEVLTQGEFADPKEAEYEIATIALYDGTKKVVHVNANVVETREISVEEAENEGIEVVIHENEFELLKSVMETILNYQVVLGWNSDAFDFLYILNRLKKLRDEIKEARKYAAYLRIIEMNDEDVPYITFLPISKHDEFNKASSNYTPKRAPLHLDLMRFFGHPSIKNYAFGGAYNGVSLNEVAQALLGETKLYEEKKVWEMTPTELVLYNAKDAELTFRLFAFDDYLPWKLLVLFGRTSKLGLERLPRHGIAMWVETMFLYEAKREGFIFPKKEEMGRDLIHKPVKKASGEWSYEGAMVIEPKPDIYEDVTVFDFASLYPTLMIEKNLSFETVSNINRVLTDGINIEIPEIKTHVINNVGLIPQVLALLRDLRVKEYKKKAKDPNLPEEKRKFYDAVQMTIKVFINASYGVFGSKTTRLYVVPTAESITTSGRLALQSVIEWVENEGGKVLYGDTDSVFIVGLDEEKQNKLVEEVKRNLNLEIEKDKVFKWVAIRSKKNYFGITEDGKLVIKGLTVKKANVPEISKKLFNEFVDDLAIAKTKEEVKRAVGKMIDALSLLVSRLKSLKFSPEEVAVKKKLGRRIDEYKPLNDIVKAVLYEWIASQGVEPSEKIVEMVFKAMKTFKDLKERKDKDEAKNNKEPENDKDEKKSNSRKLVFNTVTGTIEVTVPTWDDLKRTFGLHVGMEIPLVKIKGKRLYRMAKFAKPEEIDLEWALDVAFTPFRQILEACGFDVKKIEKQLKRELKKK